MLQANTKNKLQDRFAVLDNAGQQESHMISSRTLKRASPYPSSFLDECTGSIQKIRAVDKEGRLLRQKVDAVAYPQENMGEKYMHSSFKNKSNRHNEMERVKLSGWVGYSCARCLEPNDSGSDECSVGSCNINSESPNKSPGHFVAIGHQVIDSLCSDAEYFYGSKNQENCYLPPEKEVASSIHELELHAYRYTLQALFASGPFSWEQEELLTNLRITLHIPNDEHLMELKNLISAGAGIQNSLQLKGF